MGRRTWGLVLLAALAVGLVALASNVTSEAQLSGEADEFLVVRFTLSKLVNAGTVWAGLAVLAGWLVRRPRPALLAGPLALVVALVAHYGVGRGIGMFDATVWSANVMWFVMAPLGAPLGLVGCAARRTDRWGLMARLLVPLGAVLEPFWSRMFSSPSILPWPDRVSDAVAGGVLFCAGCIGIAVVLVRHTRNRVSRPGVRPGSAARDSCQ